MGGKLNSLNRRDTPVLLTDLRSGRWWSSR